MKCQPSYGAREPLSRTAITAEEAEKIALAAKRHNYQEKAEKVMAGIYKEIRSAASSGALQVPFDLFGPDGLKGLPHASDIRIMVAKTLRQEGFKVNVDKWTLHIIWGEE